MLFKRSYLAVALLSLFAAPSAFGQAKDSPIAFANQEAITTSFVNAPNLGGTSGGASTGGSNQWLKVEVHYGTTAALLTKYIDAVDIKIWIEGLDLLDPAAPVAGKGVAIALTGDCTYVNIPAGKDVYAVFYVHPSTIGRYSSDRGSDDFDRKFNIHVEASVGGALMDAIDKSKEDDAKWFQALKVVPNLVYRQNQSPFVLADVDRYPAIKLPDSSK
jgi:hypothetical protein